MSDSEIIELLQSSLPILKSQITATSADTSKIERSCLSYERIVRHLETVIPALAKQLGDSADAFTPPTSDAWWSHFIPKANIFVELEKRYFADLTERTALTGTHRADVGLTFCHKGRKLKILLEYKTTGRTGIVDKNGLNNAFSQQLIPYLNYEIAEEIVNKTDVEDNFICCVAVHLCEEQRTQYSSGKTVLEVAPRLAYALKRDPAPPAGERDDPNQHCFFAFHKWPESSTTVSFTDWLLRQVEKLGQAPVAKVVSATGLVNIVFGPPGSGKSRWIRDHQPHAKVFAPPALSRLYPTTPMPRQIPTSLAIEEWQHFESKIFDPVRDEVKKALAGQWSELTVVVDFGQARKDNYNFSSPYEDLKKSINKMSARVPQYRFVPLWIPLRQAHLGIAFMLWIEAVRRFLRNVNIEKNFYLLPTSVAQAFVHARQLLINRKEPDHTLFDIRIVKSADLIVSRHGVTVKGEGPVDVILRLQPTEAENKAALQKMIAAKAGAGISTGSGIIPALAPLTQHPVDIAGLEYETILVCMDTRISSYSNQINEILLACTRAKRRMWVLVDDNWTSDKAGDDPTLTSLHTEYDSIGLGAFCSG